MYEQYDILSSAQNHNDLKDLSKQDLQVLCDEIRDFLIETFSKTSGHFSSSLGTIELTVCLNHLFDFTKHSLVWDVGHQTYPHKLLTNRKDVFHTIRQKGGLSGFPKRSESPYDHFGTGHASTSISAILGMAQASKNQPNLQHIAIIGDGALTGGMAFEALNNACNIEGNALIIINKNGLSIYENVGGIHKHIQNLNPSIFELLDIQFDGEINGHNVDELLNYLKKQKDETGVRVVVCNTTKGKGFKPAETGKPSFWHAPTHFDPQNGKFIRPNHKIQDVFGQTVLELGKRYQDFNVVTPAMVSGSSLDEFKRHFPNRLFDVGIAEQHAVTFSSGMALKNKKVICVLYSTFLQRAYDQVIHDVALQNIPVIFAIDRAGVVGEDGPTHHGVFDLAFCRCIPNANIVCPKDEQALINTLSWAVEFNQSPLFIRFPKGASSHTNYTPSTSFQPTIKTLSKGKKTAIISVGKTFKLVEKALNLLPKTTLKPSHYDLFIVKPLDVKTLDEIAKSHSHIITIEDGCKTGGAGSGILEYFSTKKNAPSIEIIGYDDEFIPHGKIDELMDEYLISPKKLAQKIQSI